MNIRVLLITGSYPPMRCGIGDYSCKLVEALAAMPGIHVGVLTSVSCEQNDKIGKIDFFPILNKWGLADLKKAIKIIKQWSPDIVHIQYPTMGYGKGFLPWVLPTISFLMGKKVVQTWHEIYVRRNIPKIFLKSIIPGGLIFVRPEYVENLHPQLRWVLRRKKVALIQNASCISQAEMSRVDLDEQKKTLVKNCYLKNQKRLIVYFGFIYPRKGVELLFDVADPDLDQIVIAGEHIQKEHYINKIRAIAADNSWKNKATITGFLSTSDLAALLAVADAVILPFKGGGGDWSSTMHTAILSGAFVITTSLTQNGYDKRRNVYFAKVEGIEEMKSALATYAGTRREYNADIDRDEWQYIATQHCSLYQTILSE